MDTTEAYHKDLYQSLRGKISDYLLKKGSPYTVAEYLLSGPDLIHLLVRLSLNSDVPVTETLKVLATTAYVVSPVDLIPDVIFGPIGLLDDIGLMVFVLRGIFERTDDSILRSYWAGTSSVLNQIDEALFMIDEVLEGGAWGQVRKFLR